MSFGAGVLEEDFAVHFAAGIERGSDNVGCRNGGIGRNKHYGRAVALRNEDKAVGGGNITVVGFFGKRGRTVLAVGRILRRFIIRTYELNRTLLFIDVTDIDGRIGNLIILGIVPTFVLVFTVLLDDTDRAGYAFRFAVRVEGEERVYGSIDSAGRVYGKCGIGLAKYRVRSFAADGAFAVGAENVVGEVAVALVADRAHGLRLAGSGAARVSLGYFLVALSTFMRMVGFVLFRPLAEFMVFAMLIVTYLAVDVMFFCASRIVCLSGIVVRYGFFFGATLGRASAEMSVLVALLPFAVVMRAERSFHGFKHGGLVLGEVLFANRAVIVCDVAFFKAGRIGRRD